tara:strand:- start:3274 stop:4335 length:1062 start_codon:yes stop_codon:yes gene_type:complete
MTSTLLQLKNLSHHFGRSVNPLWTIRSINLDINPGELLGLLGPSGCGKTTLLRLIAGFERPASGEIIMNGSIVANSSFQVPPERRFIGMVFQDFALFPHLNAWKNAIFGLPSGHDPSRAMWLLDILGIADLRFRFPHELSGGQKQRLALARALAPGTSLVLLDEPFSSLDVEVRLKLRSELKQVLNSCSASGLLVTHDPQEALAICDRVAVMQNGLLEQCDTPSDLYHRPTTPFVGRFVSQGNVLKVKAKQGELITPLGSISVSQNIKGTDIKEIMVDENSLFIEKNLKGSAEITGIEFKGDKWLLRVSLNGNVLRVSHPLIDEVKIGQKCNVKFRKSVSVVFFPGGINYNLP